MSENTDIDMIDVSNDFTPPDYSRCRMTGGNNWRCKKPKMDEHHTYCIKHFRMKYKRRKTGEKLNPNPNDVPIPVKENASVDGHADKRRRIRAGRAVATRGGQPLAPVTNRQDGAANAGEGERMECDKVEFTKEEVEALLNEKIKVMKFELKAALLEEVVQQKETLSNEVESLRGELKQVREDLDHQFTQVQSLTTEIVRIRESTRKSNALEETCSNKNEQIQMLQQQLTLANEKLKMSDMSTIKARTGYEEQKRVIRELQDRLADADLQLIEAEKLRKKLHNTILELKGNIRVFCRVRPMLPDDGAEAEKTVVSYPTSLESEGRGVELMQNGKKVPFSFDRVFNHEASQKDVFVEISQLVQSALDGYKVCIFAYGQTGSGKTYTMMGMPEYPEQKGLTPRSLEQIFQTSELLSAQGWKYKMQASVLEIYNETIRDLLTSNRSIGVDLTRAEGGGFGKQYNITHDTNGNTHISDLTIIDVCNIKEVSSLLQHAAQSRSVGKTKMNEQSSRGHFVFTLRITGFNESTNQQVHGILNLIDLAGSERINNSEATGETMKQAQAINKSLSCLNRVFNAIRRKDGHVPFRDSKLTYLLQPCLGGDSKTLMFVNISPDPSSVEDSVISLQFAANVNSCEIGVARRQASIRSADLI